MHYLCLAVSVHPAVIAVTRVPAVTCVLAVTCDLVVSEFRLTSCMAVSCWSEYAADDRLQSFFKFTALAFSVLQ